MTKLFTTAGFKGMFIIFQTVLCAFSSCLIKINTTKDDVRLTQQQKLLNVDQRNLLFKFKSKFKQ